MKGCSMKMKPLRHESSSVWTNVRPAYHVAEMSGANDVAPEIFNLLKRIH